MSFYVSLSNFKAFGSLVEELLAIEVETFSIIPHGEMGWCPPGGNSSWLPPYKPKQIFLSLSGRNFDIIERINIRSQDGIKNVVVYLV